MVLKKSLIRLLTLIALFSELKIHSAENPRSLNKYFNFESLDLYNCASTPLELFENKLFKTKTNEEYHELIINEFKTSTNIPNPLNLQFWENQIKNYLTNATEKQTLDLIIKIENHPELGIKNINFYGYSLLHLAAMQGKTAIVNALLTLNTDPNSKDSYSETPLMTAIRTMHTETAILLMNHPGTNFKARDIDGNTALHIAANSSRIEEDHQIQNSGDIDIAFRLLKRINPQPPTNNTNVWPKITEV